LSMQEGRKWVGQHSREYSLDVASHRFGRG